MRRREQLTPRKKPAQTRAKETVGVILEAAAQVFSEGGYAATTTNHIAQRAGVSIGSLYQYFPNKDAILCRLMEEHIREGHEIIEREVSEMRKIGRITVPLIRRLVEVMIDLHKKEPALHRVLFEEVRYIRFWEEFRKNENLAIENLFNFLSRTPGNRKMHPEAAIRLMVHAIDSLTHRYILYGYDGLTQEEFINELTDMMSRYLLE